MDRNERKRPVRRRRILSAMAASLIASRALAHTKAEMQTGEHNNSASNPGPIDKLLVSQNTESYS